MGVYLSYDEYVQYGGTASEQKFNRFCRPACARIDMLTHGRTQALSPMPEAVKLAAFEAVELLLRRASEDEKGRMQSFSNEGMSISYARETAQERELAMNSVIVTCLWGVMSADGKTPLLYAGVA